MADEVFAFKKTLDYLTKRVEKCDMCQSYIEYMGEKKSQHLSNLRQNHLHVFSAESESYFPSEKNPENGYVTHFIHIKISQVMWDFIVVHLHSLYTLKQNVIS